MIIEEGSVADVDANVSNTDDGKSDEKSTKTPENDETINANRLLLLLEQLRYPARDATTTVDID